MSSDDDIEVEQIIPIRLQNVDDFHDNEDESDQSEASNVGMDTHQSIQNEPYRFSNEQFDSTCQKGTNARRPFSGTHGWYPQLPPTINIFACPPPPPPANSLNFGYPVFKPKTIGKGGNFYIPPHGSQVNLPTDNEQSTRFHTSKNQTGDQTPPPPDLTTPFHCEESNKPSDLDSDPSNIYKEAISCRIDPTTYRKQTRYNPYQLSTDHKVKVKKEAEVQNEKRQYLCIDTHDFSASELSVKIRDKTLTIDGTKRTDNPGRFSSMQHKFTFKNKTDVKSTSCTFHPNGTLILQFNSEEQDHVETSAASLSND